MHSIWTEKYRPQTFDEVKGQKAIIERVKAMVDQKNIGNFLFAGPAGVGKSTLALIISKQLFGDYWKQNFLELNASDERGIDVVRHTIKDFARLKAMGDVPFKIIFLDECDSLTKDAQQALRRTMENYTSSTRFIMSCNYSSKLIDPIQSRCTVFRFKPLSKEEIKEAAEEVVKGEGLKLDSKAIDALYTVCDGDARRLKNILQSCASLNKTITEDLIYSLVSAARPQEVKTVLENAVKGNFVQARDKLLDVMLQHGLSGLDIIKQIQREIWNLDIPDEKKIALVDKCGEIEFRMVEGSDEFIQLEALLANFILK
ncbi:MAG: replication factor C small subunit [Nanoarchaeota archaeon]|nr:replication factor C small subunit [Nanoarchaeota archaeon]MCG2718373.1 replication factor C small subunit [Nanoarchaeota archaeon]